MLLDRTLRFSDLKRRTPDVSQRMLTNQLRELEADGLVARKIYAEVPPRVEYSVTPLGRTLHPILSALKAWGDTNMELFGKRSATADAPATYAAATA